jgi:hypothetical protein
MRSSVILSSFVFLLAALAFAGRPAQAAPCKPSQSAAMLTGPVYAAVVAECAWVDAINRRSATAAAKLLGDDVRQVDAGGAVHDRRALLGAVADGRFGPVAMNVDELTVPFSAGSTNVVITAWTYRNIVHRVTDVFFCDVSRACTYRLIAEQVTVVSSSRRETVRHAPEHGAGGASRANDRNRNR